MMEWIQNLLDNSSTPVVVAFLLGLMTAVSPCPLATNITAIGYISKDIENRKQVFWNGILYTLGRVLAYSILGVVLICLLRTGSGVFNIQKAVSRYGEMFIPPILLLLGVFIILADKINLPSFGFKGNGEGMKKRGGYGALLLGMLFAMAFCPTSGVFYFGMLIPLSVGALGGYFLPMVFAFATGLPVIIVAWILAFSVGSIGIFYGKMKVFQLWFSRIVGCLCVVIAIYYAVVFYF
jgi:Cytochrome C biogenesis protein transmembrane region.